MSKLYDFTVQQRNGTEFPLSETRGKVVLIVNTASKCSFTPQYEGLEALYKQFRGKYGEDFVILGFPCNQFMRQEPGTDSEIETFCRVNYGVTFPVLAKLDVNGATAAPLYKWLKEQKRGSLCMKRITWNFTKASFLPVALSNFCVADKRHMLTVSDAVRGGSEWDSTEPVVSYQEAGRP
ncbi:Glutathione peroxidase [Tolypocladium capitatum]|uniref:Glutathione peroxidase n=1 Tax=Tolypocladium capitatum TaxID=45235 RepID=A0A2K3QD74_9HYPO|nr:Glutathione peroxidase [Tolypocladium capitatum]